MRDRNSLLGTPARTPSHVAARHEIRYQIKIMTRGVILSPVFLEMGKN
jgi:hypothetical protein